MLVYYCWFSRMVKIAKILGYFKHKSSLTTATRHIILENEKRIFIIIRVACISMCRGIDWCSHSVYSSVNWKFLRIWRIQSSRQPSLLTSDIHFIPFPTLCMPLLTLCISHTHTQAQEKNENEKCPVYAMTTSVQLSHLHPNRERRKNNCRFVHEKNVKRVLTSIVWYWIAFALRYAF